MEIVPVEKFGRDHCSKEEVATKPLNVEMPAGRELDALVAAKVMGWPLHLSCARSCCPEGNPSHAHTMQLVPNYSTDIAAAWEVFEMLWKKYGGELKLKMFGEARYMVWNGAMEAIATTAPLAICMAALKTCEVKL